MSIRVDFRGEERSAIIEYLKAKAEKSKAEAREKAAKEQVKELFERLGKTLKATDKSEYLYGTIQDKGEAREVVYRKTWSKGKINWEAYAKSLGGTDEEAEAFRKDGTFSASLDYASKAQLEELGRA